MVSAMSLACAIGRPRSWAVGSSSLAACSASSPIAEPQVRPDRDRGSFLPLGDGSGRRRLARRGHAQADQQVGLAGAAVAEQHDRLALVQVSIRGQVREQGRGDGRDGIGAEVGQLLGDEAVCLGSSVQMAGVLQDAMISIVPVLGSLSRISFPRADRRRGIACLMTSLGVSTSRSLISSFMSAAA